MIRTQTTRLVEVRTKILKANDTEARGLCRRFFRQRRICR